MFGFMCKIRNFGAGDYFILAFLSVERNVNEHVRVPKHMQKMGTMTHADKRKIKKADNARADI